MSDFATCFPISGSLSNEDFSKLVLTWLSGISASRVISDRSIDEVYDDDISVISDDENEYLKIKKIDYQGYSSIGMQHEIHDDNGRIWRTEFVVTRGKKVWAQIQSSCILKQPDAKHQRPKKPFLIKTIIKEGLASIDGDHIICDRPHLMSEGEVDLANRIVCGSELGSLPQVYISRNYTGNTDFDVDKMAFDLGGLAHVFVEPSRDFSIKLMSASNRKNPYGGTIALCIPERGLVKKFYSNHDYGSQSNVTDSLIELIVQYYNITNRPYALDWQSLQEHQNRQLRSRIEDRIREERTADKSSVDDYIASFDQDIKNKNEKIAQLEESLERALRVNSIEVSTGDSMIPGDLCRVIGRELYDGEISDRVRRAIYIYVNDGRLEKHRREDFLLRRLIDTVEPSGRHASISNEIRTACRNAKDMASRMGNIFLRMGFVKSEDGKHLRFTPPIDLGGIDHLTLPKTPSDHRAGKNQASDMLETLGLKAIQDKT